MAASVENRADYLQCLGLIVTRWADIDHLLVLSVAKFIGHKKRKEADVIYHTFGSFRSRIDLIRNLATHCIKSKKRCDKSLKILERIEGLWRERNAIIHSPYSVNYYLTMEEANALLISEEEYRKFARGILQKSRVERRHVRPRSSTLYETRKIPINELKDHAERLKALQREVAFLC